MHCMHKVHKSYKYTVQRRDGVVIVVGVVVVVVVEGDSCMKEEGSCYNPKLHHICLPGIRPTHFPSFPKLC